MEERFKDHLEYLWQEYNIRHLNLAVSGGVDSVVLAHLLKASGYPFSIAHCNFQLRGNESDLDEKFVKNLAGELGVDFLTTRFDTATYAVEKGISTQMAARELRYTWFREISAKDSFMATAHHANDVAETVLFNLSKGTGLAGLHGIREFDGLTVRPLLWATKDEILSYAKAYKIAWREDDSNSTNKYMRNLIRHEIVPVIEKINPNFIQTNLKTVQRLKEAEEFLAFATDQLELIDYKEGKGYINKEKLQPCPGRPTILYTLLNKHGFTYDQAVAIEQAMENTGAMFYADGWSLNIDRDHLILAPIVEPAEALLLDKDGDSIELATGILTTSVIDAKDYKISRDPTIAALDIDLLNFPLQVRPYFEGESFYPLGMKGHKKISDFLIDAKVPRTLKSEVMVLVNNNEIVWLVGMRINDRYKISATTKKVFEVRFKVRQA